MREIKESKRREGGGRIVLRRRGESRGRVGGGRRSIQRSRGYERSGDWD